MGHVAAGSEKFQWNLFPGQEKTCWQCKREGLKIDDVGEHRTLYPFRKTEFLCKTCQAENVWRAVREERERLGLQETQAHQGP